MKKNSLFRLFIFGFLKSFLLITVLIIVGYGSYRITKFYYSVTDLPADTKVDGLITDIVNDVQVDKISRNLIYSVDESSGEITDLVLEIFNSDTANLDYITIPANTQFTVSQDMFQRIQVVNPESPQIIKLSELYRYFGKDTVYDYGVILLEDFLQIDISYYTVLEESSFHQIFEERAERIEFQSSDGFTDMADNSMISEQVEVYILSPDHFLTQFSKNAGEEEIDEFLDRLYLEADSNLIVKNKKKYTDAYMNINSDFIYYHYLYGRNEGSKFSVDAAASRKLIETIIDNKAYNKPQAEITAPEVSSIGLNIEILNGSRITGLAAIYKNQLSSEGYTITRVGNYSGQTLENTKIIVRSFGMGVDLQKYFTGSSIETGTLSEDIDIQIILGKDDA